MRRVALALVSTVAGLVALLSFKTHSTSLATPPAVTGTSGDAGTSGAAPATPAGGSTSTPTATPSAGTSTGSSAAPATTTKTVTGSSVDTRWGPVQVKITVTAGKITKAVAVDYPQNNGRDEQINSYAIPALEQESVGRSDAKIDMVSGATYTSDGYIQSLQSALDKL